MKRESLPRFDDKPDRPWKGRRCKSRTAGETENRARETSNFVTSSRHRRARRQSKPRRQQQVPCCWEFVVVYFGLEQTTLSFYVSHSDPASSLRICMRATRKHLRRYPSHPLLPPPPPAYVHACMHVCGNEYTQASTLEYTHALARAHTHKHGQRQTTVT